ncbi:MAG: DegV family protein [Clostridia bacterium]|nr:DegV family protein [Clostridia bacterium]
MSYKIVADSSSNVYNLDDFNYDYVPLTVSAGDKEYVDTPETDAFLMARKMKASTEKTRTSCPNIYDWQKSFSGADNVFTVTITSNLSGSYTAAVNAKKLYCENNKNTNIHIIDSLSAGPELRLIIEKLCDLIKSRLEFSQIVEKIEEYKKRTHLLFCLESLTNLAKNGRVSPAVAHLAGLFGVRVIGTASEVGTLEALSKPRGEKKALATLYEYIKSKGFSGRKIRIAHCDNFPFAEALKNLIIRDFPKSDIKIEPCGALCSYYAELGGILVGIES